MGRTITAGATQARLPASRGDTTNEAMDAALRAEIESLWTAIRPKVLRAVRLNARLADPLLARHSQRPKAESISDQLEAEVDDAMRTIGQHWQLMSETACRAMARDGWPDANGGVDFAVKLQRDIALGEPHQLGVNQEWTA